MRAVRCQRSGLTVFDNPNSMLGDVNMDNQVSIGDVTALIDYLRQSHIYFLDFLFPRIRRDLSTALGGERKDAITRLIFKQLDSYIGEVSRHMRFEDMHLFPYVEGLLHGQLQEGFELSTFSKKHHAVDHAIGRQGAHVLPGSMPAHQTGQEGKGVRA